MALCKCNKGKLKPCSFVIMPDNLGYKQTGNGKKEKLIV